MRLVSVAFALCCFAPVASAQAPAASPARPATARSATPAVKPLGNLAQVMRAILFPNSNIIFFTQTEDSAGPKKPLDVTFGTFAKAASNEAFNYNHIRMLASQEWLRASGPKRDLARQKRGPR